MISRFAAVNALALFGLVGAGSSVSGQEATPEGAAAQLAAPARPAHIHAGTCDDLGEIVYPLNPITPPQGEAVGDVEGAVVASTSYTPLEAPLDQILGAQHAINVHLSEDRIDEYIACGEIGGVLTDEGALVIGLQELNDSGFAGVAYLSPSAAAPAAASDVSVFLIPLDGQGVGGPEAATTDQDAPLGDDGADEPETNAAGTEDAADLADDEGTEAEAGVADAGGAPGADEEEAAPDLTDEEAAGDAPESADVETDAGFATVDLADPSRVSVAAGEELTLVNSGAVARSFVVEELGIDQIVEPGGSVAVPFEEPGEYRFRVVEDGEQIVQRALVVE